MMNRSADNNSLQGMPEGADEGVLQEIAEVKGAVVRFRVAADFAQMKDEAEFFYHAGTDFKNRSRTKLYFKMDHFTGCRFGLFVYSTKETGGCAVFSEFVYENV